MTSLRRHPVGFTGPSVDAGETCVDCRVWRGLNAEDGGRRNAFASVINGAPDGRIEATFSLYSSIFLYVQICYISLAQFEFYPDVEFIKSFILSIYQTFCPVRVR